MKKIFAFKGYCESSRLKKKIESIISIAPNGETTMAEIQVGKNKYFKDDVHCKVTIIVETIKK
jgi:hypothetical protein